MYKLSTDYSLSQLKEESSNVQNQSMEYISNEMSISPVEDCSHELNNKSKGKLNTG